jgi:hypothetical protein
MRYMIRYYDIGWNQHSIEIEAETIQAAIEQILRACICTREEIITYYVL